MTEYFLYLTLILQLRLCLHAVYSDLADKHDLLKLGGSDYHGRGGQHESDLGSTNVPVLMVHEFLKVSRPIWYNAILDILNNYIKDPCDSNLQHIIKFGKNNKALKTNTPFSSPSELINQCLSFWLSKEERENPEFEAIKLDITRLLNVQREVEANEESK